METHSGLLRKRSRTGHFNAAVKSAMLPESMLALATHKYLTVLSFNSNIIKTIYLCTNIVNCRVLVSLFKYIIL